MSGVEAKLDVLKTIRPDLYEVFKNIVRCEYESYRRYGSTGIDIRETGYTLRDVKPLIRMGLVKVEYCSSRHLDITVSHLKPLSELLEYVSRERKVEYSEKEIRELLSDIVDQEHAKEAIIDALLSSEPVHVLLAGSPATGKTLFLLYLSTLPGSYLAIGSRLTKAGLDEILCKYNPRILLIDELDKMDTRDMHFLNSILEYGVISRTIHGKTARYTVKVRCVATANRIDIIPETLKSRFIIVRMKEYSMEEFVELARRIGCREGYSPEYTAKIAEECWRNNIRDIRKVRAVWRLGDGKIGKALKYIEYFKSGVML